MANLQLKERLQPSLLDRLSDDNPKDSKESPKQRFFSISAYRESVLRDLRWLLGSCNFYDHEYLEDEILNQSVINYGLPDLSGLLVSGIKIRHLEQTIKQVIINFEPRIIKNSIKIKFVDVETDNVTRDKSILGFEIHGDLYAIPQPLEFFIKTEINLEDGHIDVTDLSS